MRALLDRLYNAAGVLAALFLFYRHGADHRRL
jgi:hypothetical protein